MNRLVWSFIAALALTAVAAAPVGAKPLSIKAFYGYFKGTGIAENRDSVYFGVTVRDLDVKIRPAGEGFEINWTTVIRRGGDPQNPKVRRKSQTMTFAPAGQPGLYKGEGGGDPLSGKPYSWARIEKNSLITYVFSVNADGSYEVQSYTRTLVPTGMSFVFRRIRDGEPVRTVKGKLVKYGK